MRVMRAAVTARAVIFTLVVTVPTLTRLFWNGSDNSTDSSKTAQPVSGVPDDRRLLLETPDDAWQTQCKYCFNILFHFFGDSCYHFLVRGVWMLYCFPGHV